MDFERNDINMIPPPPGQYPDQGLTEEEHGFLVWKHTPQFAEDYAQILTKDFVLGNLRSKDSHDYCDLNVRMATYLNKFTYPALMGFRLVFADGREEEVEQLPSRILPGVVRVVPVYEQKRFMTKSVHSCLSRANTRVALSRSINGFEQEMEKTRIERKNKTIADETRRQPFFGGRNKGSWKEAEQYKYD